MRTEHNAAGCLRRGGNGRVGLAPPIVGWLALFVLVAVVPARADSVRRMIQQGNQHYAEGQYTEAINKYNEALVEQPAAIEPKFNKANSYYRLDDLGEALDLYQEVAAESKDMALVSKAKYNLGNCFFQRGAKQRDSDLQKALEDMKTSITSWRGVLEIDPENQKAARNIEVARLTIKDILDQMKKQQEQQQGQQDQQQQQGQDQQQDQQSQDPSQSQQDPNQPQEGDPQQDPNQPEDQPPPEPQGGQNQQDKQEVAPDATAREILDKEQRQREQRRILQRGQTQKVEKDW